MKSDLHDMPGHLVRRLHQISVATFQQHVGGAGHDLTPVQFAALKTIQTRPDLDQACLAGLIACDKATIGGVVERLEKKGLVSRSVSRTDKRARVLGITQAGEAVIKQVEPVVTALQDEILKGLTKKERQAFTALLKKLVGTDGDGA